jgi:hypothetical protein
MARKKGIPKEVFTVYLEPGEKEILDRVAKRLDRNGSDSFRWLLKEFDKNKLVEWHVAQTENLVSLTRRLLHEVETMRASNVELPDGEESKIGNRSGGRATVRAKISEIGGSSKDADKSSSSPQHPK